MASTWRREPRLVERSASALQPDREAGHEQVRLVRHRREALMGDPDEIAIRARIRVHRDDPESDLVAHDDDRSGARLDRRIGSSDGTVEEGVESRGRRRRAGR